MSKIFEIPNKFKHVDLSKICNTLKAKCRLLKLLLKKNPSMVLLLHYGLSAVDVVVQLYLNWIPKYHGTTTEIQILTPMTRGTLGSANLNNVIQDKANPYSSRENQLKVGERIFREGDRIIHRRNNYELNVFNGDIGTIIHIDNENLTCLVSFYPTIEVHYQKKTLWNWI